LFYNDYSSLIGVVWGNGTAKLLPVNVDSTAKATGKGGELSAAWHPLSWMDLALAYSYLDLSMTSSSSVVLGKIDFSRVYINPDTSPRHQISFHSTLDLPLHVKCTLWLRYVDALRGPGTPEYVTLDARIAWKPLPNLELSLVGQNLFEPKHQEYGMDQFGDITAPTARSMYGKVAWTF
jgi:iron complex outermembrane receptor protein